MQRHVARLLCIQNWFQVDVLIKIQDTGCLTEKNWSLTKKTLSSCQLWQNRIATTTQFSLALYCRLAPNCFFALSSFINKSQTSTAGWWDNAGNCSRMISRPQQDEEPAALTHSALLHHVWPSAYQAPSSLTFTPGNQRPKIDCSLTHANISLQRACMHTVCACTLTNT